AYAGIGRPEKFFASLREVGAHVVDARSFADHHRFRAADSRGLLDAAHARDLTLVTTEKDLARMQGDPALAELAAQSKAVPVRLRFVDEEAVRRLLARALGK